MFLDESTRAYGAVAYFTLSHTSTLVLAKKKAASVKKITFPRLELMAALITHHVATAVTYKKITCWSGRQIMLSWLKSINTVKCFILNRVEKNQKILSPILNGDIVPHIYKPEVFQFREGPS